MSSPAIKDNGSDQRARFVSNVVKHPNALLRGNMLVLILLGLAFVAGALMSPTFLVASNLQNIMLSASIVGVLAVGQTPVMLLREVDLSMGSLMAFAPIAAIELTGIIFGFFGTNVIQGGNYVVNGLVMIMALTIVISALVGLLNSVLTVKAAVPSLIATLGMLYALRGASYVLSGGNPLYLTDLDGFAWLGTHKVFSFFPVSFVIFVIVGVLAILVLRYTRVGPAIYATGGNEKAAIYSGVNTGRWRIAAFVFAGVCSGIAALFYSSRLASVEPAQAGGYELTAIAITVIGGTTLAGGRGTIAGTMLASLVLAIVINIMTLEGVMVWYQTIISGAIIIVAAFIYLHTVRTGRSGLHGYA